MLTDQNESAEARDHSTGTLVPRLYDELRRLAAYKMGQEGPGHSLTGTALLHEAYLRLQKEGDGPKWSNEKQFISAAAEAMRRILIDRIRAKRRIKRGRDYERAEFDEESLADAPQNDRLLEINEALDELQAQDPEAADVVKLRFFVGLTTEEIAEVTQVSVRTVTRQWTFAKAWLGRKLSDGGG